jgi:hypothetical protein
MELVRVCSDRASSVTVSEIPESANRSSITDKHSCKKNKADNKASKQTKKEEVLAEATRDDLSYPYSPTSSDIEIKDEESRCESSSSRDVVL